MLHRCRMPTDHIFVLIFPGRPALDVVPVGITGDADARPTGSSSETSSRETQSVALDSTAL